MERPDQETLQKRKEPCYVCQIPVEILYIVGEYLDIESLTLLQATSRHFRRALYHKTWQRLHLDIIDIGDPPEFSNALGDSENDDINDELSFLAQTRNPIRRMTVNPNNLADFCDGIVNGSLLEVLSAVSVFSLEAKYYHPQANQFPMDQQVSSSSNFDMVNWLFKRALPSLLTNIKQIELFIEVDGSHDVPIVAEFVKQLPKVPMHLRVDGRLPGDALPFFTADNIRIFKWIMRSGKLEVLWPVLGKSLPTSIERFEIVTRSPEAIDAGLLSQYLPQKNLKSLLLRPMDVKNPSGINWLPSTVEDLALFDRDITNELHPPLELPHVKYLMVDSHTGSIFRRMSFPNLERLFISAYSGIYPVDLSYCALKQLRCDSMDVRYIKKFCSKSVDSLIIERLDMDLSLGVGILHHQNGENNEHDYNTTPQELMDLVRQHGDHLKFMLLDTSTFRVVNPMLEIFRLIVRKNPQIELYVENAFNRLSARWLVPVSGFLYDGHSTIRPATKFVYRVDVALIVEELELVAVDSGQVRAQWSLD